MGTNKVAGFDLVGGREQLQAAGGEGRLVPAGGQAVKGGVARGEHLLRRAPCSDEGCSHRFVEDAERVGIVGTDEAFALPDAKEVKQAEARDAKRAGGFDRSLLRARRVGGEHQRRLHAPQGSLEDGERQEGQATIARVALGRLGRAVPLLEIGVRQAQIGHRFVPLGSLHGELICKPLADREREVVTRFEKVTKTEGGHPPGAGDRRRRGERKHQRLGHAQSAHALGHWQQGLYVPAAITDEQPSRPLLHTRPSPVSAMPSPSLWVCAHTANAANARNSRV